MNSGEYKPSREAESEIFTTFIDTEMDNYFSMCRTSNKNWFISVDIQKMVRNKIDTQYLEVNSPC